MGPAVRRARPSGGGGGTTAELVEFARGISAGVEAAFGIPLTPEPVFVGHAW